MRRLFLTNPRSQTVKAKGSVLSNVDTELGSFEELRDFETTDKLVAQAASDDTEWVFIEGGDGTAHAVMTAFLKQRDAFNVFPKFTVLPGGMTNQVCRNIGLKRATPKLIETLILNPAPTTTSTPLLRLEIDGASPHFGFLFSTGGIPTATEYCVTKMYDRGIGGSAAVAATLMRGIAGSKKIRDDMMPPTPISLHIRDTGSGTKIEDTHLATIVTTLPGLMMKLDPFWGDEDGPLRTTYASSDAKHLLKNVLALWIGRKSKDRSKDGFKSFNAYKLDYEYAGPVVVDGDPVLLPKGRVTILPTEPVAFVK